MNKESIKLNFFMNIMLNISAFIFPLISFPYISRILLPVGTGKVSFVTSVIAYFSMFAQLGIPTYGIRACAKIRDNKEELTRTSQELLLINIVMNLLVYVALFISIFLIPKFRQEKTLFIIISFTIILTSLGMEWLYKALEQYVYITIRSVIFKFIALLSMFILIREQKDYVIYGGISIFAASASNILNLINVRKYIDLKPVGNYNFKRHFKPIGIFFAMACANTIYTNLDNVFLGFIKTDIDVGYYSAAVKIKLVVLSVVTALGAVLFPRASYYVENKMKEEFKTLINKSISFIFVFATPLMIYLIIFAKEGIRFISGSAYDGAILPMQILIPTILLIGITDIFGFQILVPLGKEKIVLYSVISGGIIDIIINLILIPPLASVGAAIGTLAAEFIVFIIEYNVLKREISNIFRKLNYFGVFMAIIVASVTSVWIKFLNLGNFLTLFISSVLFFGIYALFLFIAKEKIVIEIWDTVIMKFFKSINTKIKTLKNN